MAKPKPAKALTPEQTALIKRVSAMSAKTFNACVAAYSDYQNDLNTWAAYEGNQEFDDDPTDPLPDAEEIFDFPKPVLKRIRALMTKELKRLEKSGEDISDPDTRHDAFTDALEAVAAEQNKADGILAKDYDAVAAMDNEVYDGNLSWSAINGKGKDLEAAAAITREG